MHVGTWGIIHFWERESYKTQRREREEVKELVIALHTVIAWVFRKRLN